MTRLTRSRIEARLGLFRARGLLDALPSPWQLRVGWAAMLPITLSESERERVRSRSTLLGQIPIRVPLQILYSPRQLLSSTGLALRPAAIVRHLVSVYHEDAFLAYDLQLLQSHRGGLDQLARAAAKVASGQARLAPALRALTAWPGYHAGLVGLARAAAGFDYPDPLDLDPRFCSLVGFARFCCTMPDWPARAFYGWSWPPDDRPA